MPKCFHNLSQILLATLLATRAPAHQIAELSARTEDGPGGLVLVVSLDAAYALPEYRGDEDEPAPDLAWLRQQGPAERSRILREAEAYLSDCLRFRSSGSPMNPVFSFPDFEAKPPRFMTAGIAEEPPMIEVRLTLGPAPGDLEMAWQEPFGVVLILLHRDELHPLVSGESILLSTGSGEARAPGLVRWIRIGWEHILPGGLDHILFILGIFLMLPKWKPLLTQSLVFTLSHSLALVFATFGWVHLPEKPVEAAIGLSIAWIALENLRPRAPGVRRLTVIAVFGLIHGLGFARMLADLLPAGRPDLLATGLAGFNLGVELGQIAVLAAAFALAGWWPGHAFDRLRLWGSIAIAATGAVWTVERLI